MNTTIKKTKLFWPWQDNKEEAWLEEMSANGWHLHAVGLPCIYTFDKGEARQYTYRLDYMYMEKKKLPEYLQIFQDAGWEYLGELSNWRYWRKPVTAGETQEIFTDNQSKIKKYQRALTFLGLLLLLLVFWGMNLYMNNSYYTEELPVIGGIYFIARLLYAVIIPIYIVVVIKLLQRIRQLKRAV